MHARAALSSTPKLPRRAPCFARDEGPPSARRTTGHDPSAAPTKHQRHQVAPEQAHTHTEAVPAPECCRSARAGRRARSHGGIKVPVHQRLPRQAPAVPRPVTPPRPSSSNAWPQARVDRLTQLYRALAWLEVGRALVRQVPTRGRGASRSPSRSPSRQRRVWQKTGAMPRPSMPGPGAGVPPAAHHRRRAHGGGVARGFGQATAVAET